MAGTFILCLATRRAGPDTTGRRPPAVEWLAIVCSEGRGQKLPGQVESIMFPQAAGSAGVALRVQANVNAITVVCCLSDQLSLAVRVATRGTATSQALAVVVQLGGMQRLHMPC